MALIVGDNGFVFLWGSSCVTQEWLVADSWNPQLLHLHWSTCSYFGSWVHVPVCALLHSMKVKYFVTLLFFLIARYIPVCLHPALLTALFLSLTGEYKEIWVTLFNATCLNMMHVAEISTCSGHTADFIAELFTSGREYFFLWSSWNFVSTKWRQ